MKRILMIAAMALSIGSYEGAIAVAHHPDGAAEQAAVAKQFMVATLPHRLEALNTRGDGACVLRALAPEDTWRKDEQSVRIWAGDQLQLAAFDETFSPIIMTEIINRISSLPEAIRDTILTAGDAAAIIDKYISLYILPTSENYQAMHHADNFVDIPSEDNPGVATVLAALQDRRLITVSYVGDNQEEAILFDSKNIRVEDEEKQPVVIAVETVVDESGPHAHVFRTREV